MEATARLERDGLTQLSYLMLGLWGFMLYALGPALPALRRELDVSRATVSLHTTLVALGGVAVGLVGDRFVLRIGRRAAFWVAAIAVAVAAVALALGGRIAITLPAAAVLGVGGALLVTIIQAAHADRHCSHGPASRVVANATATALGAAAPFAVALAILAGGDWRAVFVAGALLAVPALAAAYRSVCFPAAPELPHDHEPRLPRAYWLYWVALLFVVFWSTDYLETERDLAASSAAAASSLFLVGMTVGRLAGGFVAKRVRAERLLAVALAVAAAGFGAYWLLPSAAGSIAGLAVTGAGVAIAPFVLGALADSTGLRFAYAIVPALVLAGVVALAVARRAEY